MLGKWSLAMWDDVEAGGLRLSNTLELSDDYTAYMVGHFLRKLCTDILAEDYPQHLKFLIARLDAAERDWGQACLRTWQGSW
jgi:hypothetical protein